MQEYKTLGELKEAGYESRPVKTEIRENLMNKLVAEEEIWPGIHGYDKTVLPDLENALLAGHNILFLGLRGQAKTRIARMMVNLLDKKIPVIKDSEINDDPFNPVSHYGRKKVQELGDETPLEWITSDNRYVEKLATPDVTVSDLIGDVDPIKAATLKLPLSDERVLHYGLVPRSNRSIFVINELPDLQARIQVSLLNLLEESDIQIRGYTHRLDLDIFFVFTANPEDYTNRGNIITPLKDRIESQILTHYIKDLEISKNITRQEIRSVDPEGLSPLLENLIEMITIKARSSEYIDQNSGVSTRMTISARESILSSAYRRFLKNGKNKKEKKVRLIDIYAAVPAMTGKMELIYEGEQKGPEKVAVSIIDEASEAFFIKNFPISSKKLIRLLQNTSRLLDKTINLSPEDMYKEYEMEISSVDLREYFRSSNEDFDEHERNILRELVLHMLYRKGMLVRDRMERSFDYENLLNDEIDLDELIGE